MAARSEVVPALTDVFSKALKDGVSNVSFSMLSADLGRTMYEFSFRIPPYYTLLVRSLSVLEVSFCSTAPANFSHEHAAMLTRLASVINEECFLWRVT